MEVTCPEVGLGMRGPWVVWPQLEEHSLPHSVGIPHKQLMASAQGTTARGCLHCCRAHRTVCTSERGRGH